MPCAGITAYVAYQVVGQYGTGQVSFEQAMTAVFVEGFIFILLSVTGVRGGIIKYMPKSIAMASSGGHTTTLARCSRARVRRSAAPCTPCWVLSLATPARTVGIGMLLAFTGLRNMGVIVFDSATLLTLGGCPVNRRNYLYAFDAPVTSSSLANLTFSAFPAPASVWGCIDDSVGTRGWRWGVA